MEIARTLSAPTSVQIEITNMCNHKCIHCYNPCRGLNNISNSNNTLNYEQLDKILAELHENNVWHLTITGGEPLLVPNIIFYVKKKCDEYGMSVSLNSNLTLMTDAIAKKLKNDLDWNTLILTSLPGLDNETCDKITQVTNSYSHIIAGINKCKEYNIPVGVNIVLTTDNLDNFLNRIEKFVKEYRIDYLALTRAIEPSYSKDKKYDFKTSDIIMLADKLLELKEKYNIEVDSLIPFPLCVLKDQRKYQEILNTKCCAGILECTITASGDVKACSHENNIYGNIFDDGLKKCWTNMACWRNGSKLKSQCKNCKNLVVCGGDCRQSSYTNYLNNQEIINVVDKLDIPISDLELYSKKFKYNNNLKKRTESFGYALHIEGKDYLVDQSFSDIHEYFSSIKEFFINDIKDDFENESELVYLIKNLIDMRYLLIVN